MLYENGKKVGFLINSWLFMLLCSISRLSVISFMFQDFWNFVHNKYECMNIIVFYANCHVWLFVDDITATGNGTIFRNSMQWISLQLSSNHLFEIKLQLQYMTRNWEKTLCSRIPKDFFRLVLLQWLKMIP